jgi:hypothetical protein
MEMRALLLIVSAAVSLSAADRLTFLRDVSPILNKVGCSSGTCHGAAKGKNGFKLSLRGYDPQFDYEALLYDLSGRRFNRADPSRSLMLAKPTQQVPHGGGLRFDRNSSYYQTIYNWIAQGVPFGDPAKDNVTTLEVAPVEVVMPKPGEKASITVIARFGDGLTRDVTKESTVESNTPYIAKIDASSPTVLGERVGEATLLVRYQGKLATIPVSVLNPKPGFTWKALPQHNYVDQLIDSKLQRLHIQPSGLATDAEFLRRVTLDLVGQLPTPAEVREFLADPAPSRVKRDKKIDKLIGSPAFADHWTVKWGDLLQSSRKFLGEKATFAFREWIHDSVATNKPYDKMVRELLTGRGSVYDTPAANYFRTTREPKPTMEKTTQVFLGVRMVCAQCHDHPFEKWTQNQYYQMAAFFSAVGLRPGYEVGEEIVYDQRADYEMHHPKDNRVMAPQFLIASAGAVNIPSDQKRRDAFADWLVSKQNPFFAKAIANRMWSYFLGRGIIDPVDDIRASNPPVNAALLDTLSKDLIDHKFDLQALMRVIVKSRTYQASFLTNEWNALDGDNFSHAIPRRLSAEPLMDAVTMAAGVRPNFPEVPEDTMAGQLPDPHVGADGFLDLFGRPARESACECERRADLSLPQALNLINGTTISDAVADPKGRIAKNVLAGMADAAIVEDLYLATLTRFPTKSESENALKYLAGGARTLRAQDLLWALLNSKGFLYVY